MQDDGNISLVTHLACECQGLRIPSARRRVIALLRGNVPQPVQRPQGIGAITHRSPDGKSFLLKGTSGIPIALRMADLRQAIERVGESLLIPQRPLDGKAL